MDASLGHAIVARFEGSKCDPVFLGPSGASGFGAAFTLEGDTDGDGAVDLIVTNGTPAVLDVSLPELTGTVWVFDGIPASTATGARIWR